VKAILVPLDGSPLAEHGLAVAKVIARAANAKLRLALVHEPAELRSGAVVQAEVGLRRAERQYLDHLVDRLAAEGLHHVKPVVLKGDPRRELTRYADECDPDLVVLATHGRGGLARAWFGSVADHLVRNVAVPVVVVHARDAVPTEKPIERIVVALDGSKAAESVLERVAELARVLDADLLILRVVAPVPLPADPLLPVSVAYDTELTGGLETEANAYVARQVERLAASGARVSGKALVGHGVARTLLDAAAEGRAGLLVLTTRGRGGVRRLGLGSVADKVMRGAPCPVLLYRRGSKRP
jgi:nucleotide-binding universal stress UspA family protein